MCFQNRVTRSRRREVKSDRRRDGQRKARTAARATGASPETAQLPVRWKKITRVNSSLREVPAFGPQKLLLPQASRVARGREGTRGTGQREAAGA